MAFYRSDITEKSWQELTELVKSVQFVLIGGWAVYLYTKALKSKDIDILIDYDQLPIISRQYSLVKNGRLRKYEARKEEIQIDIYLPHYSSLGIETELLIDQYKTVSGFQTLNPDYLTAIKFFTLSVRGRSPKGRKDFLDIISLINSKTCDLTNVMKILSKHKISQTRNIFMDFLGENSKIPELNLNPHYFSKLKKQIQEAMK